jgi:hypothetical protein
VISFRQDPCRWGPKPRDPPTIKSPNHCLPRSVSTLTPLGGCYEPRRERCPAEVVPNPRSTSLCFWKEDPVVSPLLIDFGTDSRFKCFTRYRYQSPNNRSNPHLIWRFLAFLVSVPACGSSFMFSHGPVPEGGACFFMGFGGYSIAHRLMLQHLSSEIEAEYRTPFGGILKSGEGSESSGDETRAILAIVGAQGWYPSKPGIKFRRERMHNAHPVISPISYRRRLMELVSLGSYLLSPLKAERLVKAPWEGLSGVMGLNPGKPMGQDSAIIWDTTPSPTVQRSNAQPPVLGRPRDGMLPRTRPFSHSNKLVEFLVEECKSGELGPGLEIELALPEIFAEDRSLNQPLHSDRDLLGCNAYTLLHPQDRLIRSRSERTRKFMAIRILIKGRGSSSLPRLCNWGSIPPWFCIPQRPEVLRKGLLASSKGSSIVHCNWMITEISFPNERLNYGRSSQVIATLTGWGTSAPI